jgi:hypothetical protein
MRCYVPGVVIGTSLKCGRSVDAVDAVEIDERTARARASGHVP